MGGREARAALWVGSHRIGIGVTAAMGKGNSHANTPSPRGRGPGALHLWPEGNF